jgi:hypothetical protein
MLLFSHRRFLDDVKTAGKADASIAQLKVLATAQGNDHIVSFLDKASLKEQVEVKAYLKQAAPKKSKDIPSQLPYAQVGEQDFQGMTEVSIYVNDDRVKSIKTDDVDGLVEGYKIDYPSAGVEYADGILTLTPVDKKQEAAMFHDIAGIFINISPEDVGVTGDPSFAPKRPFMDRFKRSSKKTATLIFGEDRKAISEGKGNAFGLETKEGTTATEDQKKIYTPKKYEMPKDNEERKNFRLRQKIEEFNPETSDIKAGISAIGEALKAKPDFPEILARAEKDPVEKRDEKSAKEKSASKKVAKLYEVSFTGRKKDAIGIFYPITDTVEAENEADAKLKLYDKYDHVFKPVFKEVDASKKLATEFPFSTEDSLLDGFTYQDLIDAVIGGEEVRDPEAVGRVFQEMLDANVLNANEMLTSNLKKIMAEIARYKEGSKVIASEGATPQEIAESFVNRNIEWTLEEVGGDINKVLAVEQALEDMGSPYGSAIKFRQLVMNKAKEAGHMGHPGAGGGHKDIPSDAKARELEKEKKPEIIEQKMTLEGAKTSAIAPSEGPASIATPATGIDTTDSMTKKPLIESVKITQSSGVYVNWNPSGLTFTVDGLDKMANTVKKADDATIPLGQPITIKDESGADKRVIPTAVDPNTKAITLVPEGTDVTTIKPQ